ncbi:hypothetical protein ACFPRL_18125 [Pseudoclavibacter helvolus]
MHDDHSGREEVRGCVRGGCHGSQASGTSCEPARRGPAGLRAAVVATSPQRMTPVHPGHDAVRRAVGP